MIQPRSLPSPQDVARHYDELDGFYRDIWGDHLHHGYWEDGGETADEAVIKLIDLAAQRSEISDGHLVCDIGCGYGATAECLARRYGVDVTGITLSAAQFAYATDRYASSKCRFIFGDWVDNDFDDDCFDVAIGIECLSHVTSKSRFFDQAYRVLKPGGRLVLFMWLANGHAGARQIRLLLEPICREGRLPSMATNAEVIRFAEDAGFTGIEVEKLSSLVRRTWSICARRLATKLVTDRRYRRYLFDTSSSDRAFLKTIIRIIVAYRTGVMEYGLFVGRKPE